MGRKAFLTLLLLLCGLSAFPQILKDTTFISAAIQNTANLYHKAIGAQARLYNGSKYLAPDHTLEQHPYFLSEDWIMGDVFYDGEAFRQVPLMLDLYNGQLITEHYSSGHAIQLVKEKLHHFTIEGHYFEKIENDSVAGSLPQTDFYDILHGGTTKLVAKRQKFIREQIVSNVVERSFDDRNRYFLFKNGVYFPVKSKSSVLKLMSDRKQEMKKFLKQQPESTTKNRELLMKSLAEYYDTLK